MTQSLQASAAHIATTRSGGTIVYQADGIQVIDAIAAFIVFLVVLLWGAVISGSGDVEPGIVALPAGRPQKPQSWRGSGVGRIWLRQYLRATVGGAP